MIRVDEWPNATQFLDRTSGAGRDRPRHPLVSKDDLAAMSTKDKDASLAALVRQWMKTSEAVERQARPEGDDSPLRPTWTPPVERPPVSEADLAIVPRPALPRRHKESQPRPTRRLAVLIDAQTAAPEAADVLFEVLADQGTVSVCRAYADWTSPEARGWWSAPLRQHGIQPHHHFAHHGDQSALVALTIDAVDLARDSAVDTVVLVGDLTSQHPLVAWLNAAGLQVLAFGTTSTPDDVRALCHEYVDLTSSEGVVCAHGGKHCA
jgi:NYN domain